MTEEITTAALAAEMFAADMSVEDEIERLRNRARSAALADMFGSHLPSHLPPLRLSCRDDYTGNHPRLSAYPAKSGVLRDAEVQAEAFAAWLADQGIEDYTVRGSDGEHNPTVFIAQLRLMGLPVTLRLFLWPWEADAQAAEALVAKALDATRMNAVEVSA